MAFIKLHSKVPKELQEAICAIPWKKAGHASYRKCKSVHFGLSCLRNVNRKAYYGLASHNMPELQKMLTDFIRKTAPDIERKLGYQLNFASIIVNRYAVGESMDEHIDRNWNRQSMQLVGRFGEGRGGELEIAGNLLQTGVFLVDGNIPHRVLECEAGTLYSFVTYIKQHALPLIVPALPQLKAWGFQLSLVSKMYVHLALTLLALLQLQGALAAHDCLQLRTNSDKDPTTVRRTFSWDAPAAIERTS
jgi:hypothetical protein